MILSVYNIKGGTGKTTLSVQLAKIFNLLYVSNDAFAGATNFMGEDGCFVPDSEKSFPVEMETVYDFGGFKDPRITDVLIASTVIVPTLISPVDLQATLTILKDLSNHTPKVIVIVNRVKKDGDYLDFIDLIKTKLEENNIFFEKIDFVSIKESSFLQKSIIEEGSIFDKVKESAFNAHIYKTIHNDFINLKETIEKH